MVLFEKILTNISQKIETLETRIMSFEADIASRNEELSFLRERLSFAEKKYSEQKIELLNLMGSLTQKKTTRTGIETIQSQIETKERELDEKKKELQSALEKKKTVLSQKKTLEYINRLPQLAVFSVLALLLVGIVAVSIRIAFPPHQHIWVEATCENAKVCSECGETEGEPLGHSWNDATCVEPQKCERCGETKGDPLGHDWEDATCSTPKTCKRCGLTEGTALSHIIEQQTVIQEATCGEKGKAEGVCSLCGETITTDIPATGNHKYGEWKVDKEATTSSEGREIQECIVCGHKNTRSIPRIESKTMSADDFVKFIKQSLKFENSKVFRQQNKFIVQVWQDHMYDAAYLAASDPANYRAQWDDSVESLRWLSEQMKKSADENGLSKYDIEIELLNDTNLEQVLARVINGKVDIDIVSYLLD